MLRIETDGSGCRNVIVGCPYCEDNSDEDARYHGSKALRYHLSGWLIDKGRDAGLHSVEVKYCPFCGEKLPCLDGWVVINEHQKGVKNGTTKHDTGKA